MKMCMLCVLTRRESDLKRFYQKAEKWKWESFQKPKLSFYGVMGENLHFQQQREKKFNIKFYFVNIF